MSPRPTGANSRDRTRHRSFDDIPLQVHGGAVNDVASHDCERDFDVVESDVADESCDPFAQWRRAEDAQTLPAGSTCDLSPTDALHHLEHAVD
jgi:hypothetical protein